MKILQDLTNRSDFEFEISCPEAALQICEHFFATLLIRIMEIYNDYYDQLPCFALIVEYH